MLGTAQQVFKEVPEVQRQQYNREFEILAQLANELDKRMEFYHAVYNEELTTRKYLALVSFS